jgi:uncharacterized protein (DUF608 family)
MTLFEDLINKRDQDSPFIRMVDFATNKVTDHATVFTEELHKDCNKIYDEVFNQFGDLMTKTTDDHEDVAAVKTALRDYLPNVDAKMSEIIKKLKAIERDPRPEPKLKTTRPSSDKIKGEKHQDKGVKVKTEFKTKVKSEVKQEQQ